MPTPWRKLSYEQLSTLELSGKVLDLGGSRKSKYHELIRGNHAIEVVNIDENSGLDNNFDLEKPFPLQSESYDAVLACNVLEHIYNYQNIFTESCRVLRKGGTIIIIVPFIMFFHPSPHDYWRYTKETLNKLLIESNFIDISIVPIGQGPFLVLGQMFGGVRIPELLRMILYYKLFLLDKIISLFVKSEALKERYPLGYFVTAKKKV
ncbi:MAG: SAM-dependent methyltransferase [Parcubacteria group bacterium GW2011_GWD2_42_14]|nr:MAG: SAM-dependent methyltransferase [Parcubacteria group bacterium GW2011_GWD2_42_14]